MLVFLIARLSSIRPCGRRILFGSLHHNASHIFNLFCSAAKSCVTYRLKQKQRDGSITISYLMNSCGLSTKLAIDISKRVNLKNTHDPDSVLNLFRNYGFSDIQISKIVQKHPKVLLMKSEKSLLPKLRFFQSIGFSCSQLPELLVSKPLLLLPSLKQCIIPRYESLKSVLDDNQKVIKALRCPAWDFLKLDARNVDLNIKFLRQLGVPQSSVSSLVTKFPGVAFMEHAKFVENVQFIRKAGIPTFKVLFIRALYVSSLTKKSTWEFKLDIFERCGWSRDVTFSAFMKFPFCMLLSEDKITSTMKFLVDEMDMSLDYIAKRPLLLGFSLKQRIIPRFSVLKILKNDGLMKSDMSLCSIVSLSETKFLEKFVIPFQESVPKLLDIYKSRS